MPTMSLVVLKKILLKLGGANTNVEDMGFSIKDNKKKIDNFNLKFLNNELKKLFLQ